MPDEVGTPPTPSAPPSPPAPAAGAAAAATTPGEPVKLRRRLVWACVWSYVLANALMIMRFFFPRALFEPKTVFSVGYPTEFGLGVDTRFQQAFRIWVVRNTERLFVIFARCTHLGCTPDWKESENKFKCPCHGSGYDSEGVNFEGPAPRPMDRARVWLDPQGRVMVDVNTLFVKEKGGRQEFDKEDAFLRL